MDKGQMKKGVLEMCVLSVISREDKYGYELMKLVTSVFTDVNESTVYAVLRRLKSEGCAELYMGTVSGGPERKYYRITDSGRERLICMKSEWDELTGAVSRLMV